MSKRIMRLHLSAGSNNEVVDIAYQNDKIVAIFDMDVKQLEETVAHFLDELKLYKEAKSARLEDKVRTSNDIYEHR